MIQVTYLDPYKIERTLEYENYDAMMLAFSGCITVPDYLKITSLTYKGHKIPYDGLIGDFYKEMSAFDFSPYEK